MARVLVLGVGNTLLQDEGLGVRAVEQLQTKYVWPAEVTLLDGGTLGLDLLSRLDGVTHLLLLDAVVGRALGDGVIRLTGSEVSQDIALKLSVHQVGLQELLAAASLLGSLPHELVLLGLAPVTIEWGDGLSEPVQAQLGDLVRAAVAQLHTWGVDPLVAPRAPAG